MNKNKTLNDKIIGFFESDEVDELDEVEKEFNGKSDEEIDTITDEPSEKYLNANPQMLSSTPNYKTANPVIKKIKIRKTKWLRDDLPIRVDLSDPYNIDNSQNYNDQDY